MKPTETNTPKRWLTPNDLANEYGFSKSNQDKLRMNRKIPFCKIGRYVRYDRLEIDKWIEDNRVDMIA
ncbi:helix-turn-helix domain-containing protein [bacterium]|nr:helix-turn-helix domain-containing protein [bacterium]MBU1958391.1 helix-turn-helix domain-containing protein [bacterium]